MCPSQETKPEKSILLRNPKRSEPFSPSHPQPAVSVAWAFPSSTFPALTQEGQARRLPWGQGFRGDTLARAEEAPPLPGDSGKGQPRGQQVTPGVPALGLVFRLPSDSCFYGEWTPPTPTTLVSAHSPGEELLLNAQVEKCL